MKFFFPRRQADPNTPVTATTSGEKKPGAPHFQFTETISLRSSASVQKGFYTGSRIVRHHRLNLRMKNAAATYMTKAMGGASIAIAFLAARGISLLSAESAPAEAAPPQSPPIAPPTNIKRRGRYDHTTQNVGSGGITSIS